MNTSPISPDYSIYQTLHIPKSPDYSIYQTLDIPISTQNILIETQRGAIEHIEWFRQRSSIYWLRHVF